MALPEPRNQEENVQIRDINKDSRGRWHGDIFLGIEGAFNFEETDERIAFDHWRGRRPYVGQADHFVLMVGSGEWAGAAAASVRCRVRSKGVSIGKAT